jgi:hypothetical protein
MYEKVNICISCINKKRHSPGVLLQASQAPDSLFSYGDFFGGPVLRQQQGVALRAFFGGGGAFSPQYNPFGIILPPSSPAQKTHARHRAC